MIKRIEKWYRTTEDEANILDPDYRHKGKFWSKPEKLCRTQLSWRRHRFRTCK